MEVKLDTGFSIRSSAGAHATPGRRAEARDSASFVGAVAVERTLAATPEVRTNEVARGQELFASSSYPPDEVIHGLSRLLAREWAGSSTE